MPPHPQRTRLRDFAAFGIMIFILSFTLNVYIWFHLSYLWHIPHDLLFWGLLVLSTVSWFLAMAIDSVLSNRATGALYIASLVWMGFEIYMMFALEAYDIVRLTWGADPKVAATVLPAVVIGMVVASMAITQFIRVRRIGLGSDKLTRDLRIVQLSDMHIGAIHGRGRLARLVRLANAQEPDVVLITGDLVDGPGRFRDGMFSLLDDLKAPVLFTTGNHEYYAGLDEVLAVLARTRVRVLRNELAEMDGYSVIGLDDGWGGAVGETLSRIPHDRSAFTVLMFHRPSGLEAAAAEGVDLQLSGHTHGGQFVPFPLLARAIWRRYSGLHEHGGAHLYCTTGAGTWGPPFRLGTMCEIAVFDIKGHAKNIPTGNVKVPA
jgi:hypothetical protein